MEQQYHERLRKYRESAHLTQEELAEKIDVSRQTVSKWERGEASPDTDNLLKLSSLYQVTVDALLKNDPCETAALPDAVAEVQANDAQADTESDEDGDEVCQDERDEPDGKPKKRTLKRFLLNFPIAVLCAAVYLALGVIGGYWHPGWLIFFVIPIWDGLVDSICDRNPRRLPIPVITAAVYLWLGCCFDLWHPGWLVFLLIPIFGYIQHYFS